LNEFRSNHNLATPGDWIRFAVPTNLRENGDRHMPAANVVSMVFLDRNDRDFADPDRLLRGINRRIRHVKYCRLGLLFVLSLPVLRLLPGGLGRQTPDFRCVATCVLSNLGNVFQNTTLPQKDGKLVIGDVTLDEVAFLPPIRPFTDTSFGLFSYAGKLNVTLQYDPRLLSAEDSQDLIDMFRAQTQKSIRGKQTVAEA